MKVIQREGKTEYDVVTKFMKEFNLRESDFTREVIDTGSKGFLSIFGIRPTIVRFFIKDDDDQVKVFLDGLLKLMGVKYEKIEVKKKSPLVTVTINGVDEKGFLIGKEGRLLESLQHLLYRLLAKGGNETVQVQLDIDGYRQKQERNMVSKIRGLMDKVKATGKSVTLEPMKSSERRIVHKLIETESKLKTLTIGEGERKRVVIMAEGENPERGDGPRERPEGPRERPEGQRDRRDTRRDRPDGPRERPEVPRDRPDGPRERVEGNRERDRRDRRRPRPNPVSDTESR